MKDHKSVEPSQEARCAYPGCYQTAGDNAHRSTTLGGHAFVAGPSQEATLQEQLRSKAYHLDICLAAATALDAKDAVIAEHCVAVRAAIESANAKDAEIADLYHVIELADESRERQRLEIEGRKREIERLKAQRDEVLRLLKTFEGHANIPTGYIRRIMEGDNA